jgi:hypothetical protein
LNIPKNKEKFAKKRASVYLTGRLSQGVRCLGYGLDQSCLHRAWYCATLTDSPREAIIKNRIANLGLMIGSVLLTLFVLEVGHRTYKGEWSTKNFSAEARVFYKAAYGAKFDRRLGWVPRPGPPQDNYWKTQLTILEGGIRSNGEGALTPGPEAPVILAVGDSFTFGDQVSDGDTWPAVLERKLGVPVVNGGVFAYGLDQTYLRLLDLNARYRPQSIIVSMIPDDVSRCGLSARAGAAKPYFDVGDQDEIILRRAHIPETAPEPASLSAAQRFLGYSFFLHRQLKRAMPEWWMSWSWENKRRVHDRGLDVACGLFARLAKMARTEDVRIYVLLQYVENEWEMEYMTEFSAMIDRCVDQEALLVVDSLQPLWELKNSNPAVYDTFYDRHMTKAGNAFIGSLMAEALAGEPGQRPLSQ